MCLVNKKPKRIKSLGSIKRILMQRLKWLQNKGSKMQNKVLYGEYSNKNKKLSESNLKNSVLPNRWAIGRLSKLVKIQNNTESWKEWVLRINLKNSNTSQKPSKRDNQLENEISPNSSISTEVKVLLHVQSNKKYKKSE